ncbi:MAG: hypothetical protein EOO73_12950 [Myxococcales bacterium]|nr:MAG: hypothetical protein EOO73_12950 [Myxococcales bacterium]
MLGTTWLAYFENNAREDRAPTPALAAELPSALHGALAESLGRFQLGESAGGKIHEDIATLRDAALDPPTRRAIQLYIEEEWRHARELALVIHALGGELQRSHWTNGAFTACRRLLGLRTKMMTLAIAEVIGIVYYRALAAGLGSAGLSSALSRIANEESAHLDFQAAFFEHVVRVTPRPVRELHRWLLCALMLGVLIAACGVLWLDHGRLLRHAGCGPWAVARDCWRQLAARRFLGLPAGPTRALGFEHG